MNVDKIIEQLNKTPVVILFAVIGVLFVLVGTASGFPLFSITVSDTLGRVTLIALGIAFIIPAFVLALRKGAEKPPDSEKTSPETTKKDEAKGSSPSSTGLRLLSPQRRGYAGYFQWAMDGGPQDMFFAGHAVLHRFDEDFRFRGIGTAEAVIARKLSEGSTIKILLHDPRSDMVRHLVREEGQSIESYLSDSAVALGICQRLSDMLQLQMLPPTARLGIHIYNDIPYYAYHAVGDQVAVGFYFYSPLGFSSAVYEAIDPQTKEFFKSHFQSILSNYLKTQEFM